MIWKTPDGNYLLQGAASPIPMEVKIVLRDGESVAAAAKYYLVSPAGHVLREFGAPTAYSFEEDLGISDIHCVVDRRLLSFHWIDRDARGPVVNERLELADLMACDPGGVPFEPAAVMDACDERLEAALKRNRREPFPLETLAAQLGTLSDALADVQRRVEERQVACEYNDDRFTLSGLVHAGRHLAAAARHTAAAGRLVAGKQLPQDIEVRGS